MANTFTSLHVHVVFSTKNRECWLTADVEEDVRRYPGGICRAHKVTALSAFVTSIQGDDPEAAAAWQKTID